VRNYWKTFWERYPLGSDETEYLKQVGKTVGGVSISNQQFDAIIDDIDKHLNIRRDDIILDLCCGNGLLTREIAKKCKEVVAIDFSEPLIRQAKKITAHPDVTYIVLDVRDLVSLAGRYRGFFTKVLCYEALAFFGVGEFYRMLQAVKLMARDDAVILMGSVLDHERKWNFFNTFRRKMTYFLKIVLLRQEVGLGKWWKRREIENVCHRLGFRCEFHYQNTTLHTAHYRIDIRISSPQCCQAAEDRNRRALICTNLSS
jgi:cyclopropane fatty-acyl-phospholipid synthase-like methyltransferase